MCYDIVLLRRFIIPVVNMVEQKSLKRSRKRRHPVNGKLKKKSCFKVLAKNDSTSTDGMYFQIHVK